MMQVKCTAHVWKHNDQCECSSHHCPHQRHPWLPEDLAEQNGHLKSTSIQHRAEWVCSGTHNTARMYFSSFILQLDT